MRRPIKIVTTVFLASSVLTWSLALKALSFPHLGAETLSVCSAGLAHSSDISVAGTDSLSLVYEDVNRRPESISAHANGILHMHDFTSASWLEKITAIDFNFSTEKYGTQYFIDVCYQGPESKTNPSSATRDDSEGIYGLSLHLGSSETEYRKESHLAIQTEVLCDLRNLGQQRKPRFQADTPPSQIEPDSIYRSEEIPWATSSLDLDFALNNSNSTVPRFCRIRLYFLELNVNTNRSHLLSPSDVDLFIEIQKLAY